MTEKILNSEAAIRDLLVRLRATYKITIRNTIFCAEHMGLFATFLLRVLTKRKFKICLESPLRIKRSLGIIRGKNDRIDAIRIAQYASKNVSVLRFWSAPRAEIEQLRQLSTIRKRMIKTKVMLTNSKKTETYFLTKKQQKTLSGYLDNSVNAIKSDIAKIEEQMMEIVETDGRLRELMRIMTSIPRIGRVVAMEVLIGTNEFKNFSCPKEFASYCGVAPFEWVSGKSVRGKARVSQVANKELKMMLHMAAIGYAMSKKSALGKYYHRKVAEGKNKMSVLNAVRNKLIHRIFACVRENRPYTETV